MGGEGGEGEGEGGGEEGRYKKMENGKWKMEKRADFPFIFHFYGQKAP